MKPHSILIIEDNNDIRENLAEILELAGYKVETAVDGLDGAKKISSHYYDLVLCDIMMPKLDGYGVLKIMMSMPQYAAVPFIFLTAKTEKIDFRKAMAMGASDFISKPFDDQDLLSSIEIRLQKSNANPKVQKAEIDQVDAKYFVDLIVKNIVDEEVRHFTKKDVIYSEGSQIRYVYYVQSGLVKQSKTNDMAKELTINIYGKGDIFGIDDVILRQQHSSDVHALIPTDIIMIPKFKFKNLIQTDTKAITSIMKWTTSNVQYLHRQSLIFAYSSVRKKVSNALVYIWSKNYHNPEISFSREDLAYLAGTAKETLIRTLSEFKDEGIISIDPTKITIIQLEKLIKMPE